MTQKSAPKPADFIHPLDMNGLHGRMLRMPAPARKRREILFIYGHHSSLERWWGLIQELNRYGAITVPDLPGFGGMDSFYKIGEKPTIDNYADYLAAFIKLRFKHRKLTIAGLSFGFVVVTRMLQRYPELAKNVDLLVSVVGFSHRDDFIFGRAQYYTYRILAWTFSSRPAAWFFKGICLNPLVLKLIYQRTPNARRRLNEIPESQQAELMNIEVYLWHCNEVRTYMNTTRQFLAIDNCKQQVDLPVWHIAVDHDQYLDPSLVEQHLRVIYKDFHPTIAKLSSHAPTVIATAQAAAQLIPPQIRTLLNKP